MHLMIILFEVIRLINPSRKNNWKGAILLLNSIVARCCNIPQMNSSTVSSNGDNGEATTLQAFYPCLADALLMLSESYLHLSRYVVAPRSVCLVCHY